jgi:hypothetical protein
MGTIASCPFRESASAIWTISVRLATPFAMERIRRWGDDGMPQSMDLKKTGLLNPGRFCYLSF